MKAFLIGLWVTLVALGSTYAAAMYHPKAAAPAATAEAAALQHQKTRVLNVPLIGDGVVQGFMAMQFEMAMDGAALKALQVPPEIYLLDEAFKTIYADKALDFRNLTKYDIAGFTAHLMESTNARLGVPLIKDVLIVDFSYIPKDGSHL